MPAAAPVAPRKRPLQEVCEGQASAPPAKKVAAAPSSPSSLSGAAPLAARGNAAQPRPAPNAPVSPARTVLDEQDAARSEQQLREQQLRRAFAGAPCTSAAPTPTPTPTPAIERTTTQTTSALSRVAVKVSSHKPRKATSEYATLYVESLPDLQNLPQRGNARR